jgi:hypothetical protein
MILQPQKLTDGLHHLEVNEDILVIGACSVVRSSAIIVSLSREGMSRPELRSNNGSHIIDVSILIMMCVGRFLRIFPWLKVEKLLYVAAEHSAFNIDAGGCGRKWVHRSWPFTDMSVLRSRAPDRWIVWFELNLR